MKEVLMKPISKRLALCLPPLFMAGCALIPRDKLAEPVVADVPGIEKNIAEDKVLIQKNWWQSFGDPHLNELMEKALKGSPSLTQADARIAAAQALFEANRGALIPQVGISGQVSRQQLSQTYIYAPGLMQPIMNYGFANAGMQWSLDLWGKQKKLLSSAQLKLDSAKASYEAARLGLAGMIANIYVDYDQAVRNLEFASQEAKIRQNLFEIAQLRKNNGILDDSALNQKKIESDIASVRASQMELVVKQLQHQLAVLAGEGPSWGEKLPKPAIKTELIGGNYPQRIPADLLARRPDLQALLKQVEAARLELGAAKLDYLPNIDLNANIGYQAYGLDRLFESRSQIFGIGPVLSLPIFDGGRIDANALAKEAGRNQVIAQYHETLLQALRQSADGIATFKTAKADLERMLSAQASMQRIHEATQSRMKNGIVSNEYLYLSESNLIKQNQALAEAQARLANAHIALVQALGGGYGQTIVQSSQSQAK